MSAYAQRAEHYPLEFGTTEDFELLRTVIPDHGLVLDVPCGSGRLLDLFAEGSCQIVMVDVEPRMTEKSADRAAVMGLSQRVSVRTADMRTLDMEEHPNAVLVAHGGLQMLASLADVRQTLESLTAVAAPGATLYFDTADPWGAGADSLRLLPPFMSAREEASGEQSYSNEGFTMNRRWHSRWDDESLEVQFSYHVTEDDAAGVTEMVATSRWLRVRAEFLLREFERLGIETSAALGHHDGRPYMLGSPRCILIGRTFGG